MDLIRSLFLREEKKVYLVTEAVPLSADKVEAILKLSLYDSSKLLELLAENITSIYDQSFYKIIYDTYDKALKHKLIELYLPKVHQVSMKTLLYIINLRPSEAEKVEELKKYKDRLITMPDFDAEKFAQEFWRKRTRNQVLRIFNLPEEEYIGEEGIEIFGKFYPMHQFKTKEKYLFNDRETTFTLEHQNGKIDDDEVYISIQTNFEGGSSHSRSTFTLKGTWILGKYGLIPE